MSEPDTEVVLPTKPTWGYNSLKHKFRFTVNASETETTAEGTWVVQSATRAHCRRLIHTLRGILAEKGMDKLTALAASDAEVPLKAVKAELSPAFEEAAHEWWRGVLDGHPVRRTYETEPASMSSVPNNQFKEDITPEAIDGQGGADSDGGNVPAFSVKVDNVQEHEYRLRNEPFTWVKPSSRYVRFGSDFKLVSTTGGADKMLPLINDWNGPQAAALTFALTGIVRSTMGARPTSGPLPVAAQELLARRMVEITLDTDEERLKAMIATHLSSTQGGNVTELLGRLYRLDTMSFILNDPPSGRPTVYHTHTQDPTQSPTPPVLKPVGSSSFTSKSRTLTFKLSGCLLSRSSASSTSTIVQFPSESAMEAAGVLAAEDANIHLSLQSAKSVGYWSSGAPAQELGEVLAASIGTYFYVSARPESLQEWSEDLPSFTTTPSTKLKMKRGPQLEIHWTPLRADVDADAETERRLTRLLLTTPQTDAES